MKNTYSKYARIENLIAQNGLSTLEACKKADVSVPTFYNWRQRFKGIENNSAVITKAKSTVSFNNPAVTQRQLALDTFMISKGEYSVVVPLSINDSDVSRLSDILSNLR